jgi:ADP-heptose:LPS heptosyltransferase
LIGINISAGSKARFWGIENYRRLIKFLSGYNVNILVLSSPRDANDAVEIAAENYVNFFSTDFGEFAAIISRLNFLFTPDTAVVHLASAFEIPMFGIYVKYNTTDMIWSPYKMKYESIITTNYNLEEITIEQVIGKLKPYLENILHEHSISE